MTQISTTARTAARQQDWATVDACAQELLKRDNANAEGHFLAGLVMKASRRPAKATEAFAKVLNLDADRYDAAIELANQHSFARRNADAAEMLARYEGKLGNSPLYLDMAGTVYSDIGMPDRAWPLFQKAYELQPGVDLFQANLAACSVFLGKIEEAKAIYKRLLERFPTHQRNHYQLARLEKAKDSEHIERMQDVLDSTNLSPDRNIFIYYAIGKELEDLGDWDEAFHYYKMAGDAVASVANYDIDVDLQLIDKIIKTCDADWLANEANDAPGKESEKTPVFVVGLPRTGTTLTERILSSHSQVASLGETEFMQMTLRRASGVETVDKMNAEVIEAVAQKNITLISEGYLKAVSYRLGDKPMFIDKLPFNYLYLGFIAKAYPNARIVHLRRNPLDSCFAMYKQVFTWAYKFSYTLESLGQYYVAYDRLCNHWRDVLKGRQIEIEYESLVADQEGEIRALLEKMGLGFEDACLNFDRNITASTTASSVQIREKIHTRSIDRWMNFAKHLQPLKSHLENAGIVV